jgi:hypothetical protein
MKALVSVIGTVFCLALPAAICAQGLFESAGQDSSSAGTGLAKNFSLSGYVKGSVYGGRNDNQEAVMSGGNAQLSLKVSAEKSGIGKAFAEARLNAGKLRDSAAVSCDVREAWASVSPGPVDIKLGRQIVAWGRADAINPTNNITPMDQTALSSEYDDTRLGNELLQVKAKFGPTSIQGIWVPYYRPDVLPLGSALVPAGVTIAKPVYPDVRFVNGGYALRFDLTLPAVDGSLSYFNGYGTLPGFDYELSRTGMSLFPHAYRMQVGGLDFSTTVASLGLRGEAALKYPNGDYKASVYIPNPSAQYVVGVDKSLGDWTVLVQYSGVYVLDYNDIEQPVLTNPYDPMAQALYASALAANGIDHINRLYTGTADKLSHSVTANIQWNTLHETLRLQLAGMYNFTTDEYAVNPSVSYDVADAVGVTVGGRYLNGPDESLNHMIRYLLSFAYAEVKVSF